MDDHAAQVIQAIFDAASRFRSARLPELFAGLAREPGGFPVQYLGANVPQAWAAGAVVHAVQVLISLHADAPARTLTLRPAMPSWLREIRLANLGLGPGSVDFSVQRNTDGSHELHGRTGRRPQRHSVARTERGG
jgi:glycogen debranching enzyme